MSNVIGAYCDAGLKKLYCTSTERERERECVCVRVCEAIIFINLHQYWKRWYEFANVQKNIMSGSWVANHRLAERAIVHNTTNICIWVDQSCNCGNKNNISSRSILELHYFVLLFHWTYNNTMNTSQNIRECS